MRKIQLPAIGGIRKVIKGDAAATPATTITGLEGTVTLAQLAALITQMQAQQANNGGGNIGDGTEAVLVVGPGLSGGGPMLGKVPLRLTAPIPWGLDDGGGGGDGDPGPPGLPGKAGANGATGGVGPVGPAVFMSAEDGQDGQDAIPGNRGATGLPGTNGTTGGQGPIGPVFFPEDGEDGDWGPPGMQGPQGAAGSGGGSSLFNVTPDSHPTTPAGVGLGPNDEFETGTSIDTAGTRYSGATAWSAFNLLGGSSAISNGSLAFSPALSASLTVNGYVQAVPGGSWTYTAKIQNFNHNASGGLGLIVAPSTGFLGKFYSLNLNVFQVEVQAFTSATLFSATAASSTNATILLSSSVAPPNTYPIYLRIAYNGTSLIFSYSITGIEAAYTQLFSVTTATFLGAAPTMIGIGGFLQSATVQGIIICDWFRRTA